MATNKKPAVKKPSDLVSSVAKDLKKVTAASKKSVKIAEDIANVPVKSLQPSQSPGAVGTMVGGTYIPVAGVAQTATAPAVPNTPTKPIVVGGTTINVPASGPGSFTPPTAPPSTPPPGIDTDRRDAFAILKDTFASYGLDSLAGVIESYMKSDMGPYEASLKLKQEQVYKDRFKGNELRRSKGLNVLSEAEYLNQENTYQEIFSSYNQIGIMGKTQQERRDYMADLMARNLDPVQVRDRMDAAVSGIKNADPYAKAQLKAVYNLTEDQMVGFVLAPEQTLADINLKLSAAAVAGAATQYGFGAGAPTAAQMAQINALPEPQRSNALEGLQRGYAQELQTKAEGMVRSGVSAEQAREGYSTIAGGLKQGQTIAARYGGQYDLATAESEVFQRNQEAGRKRKRFASLERAAFGGQSGATFGGGRTAGQV